MQFRKMYSAVDSHTEGMPTRVITGGMGVLPGRTMAERRRYLITERDGLRTLLMYEPRGHSAMSGAILQPPCRADADAGVIFIEVSGCLPMCGHGAIGVATVLVETGVVEVKEPITDIRLDTPAGLVEAAVEVDDGRAAAVTIRNVPSYLHLRDAEVSVAGLGRVRLDLAWGGNFYAVLPASDVGLAVEREFHDRLVALGLEIMSAVNEQLCFAHPEHQDITYCHHVIFTAPGGAEVSARGATAIHPGWIDRSPCGTGTSARMAQLYARGEIGLHEDFVHASLIGSRFTGRLVETARVGDFSAVIPTVRGRAWITGLANYVLDPDDPFPAGFLLPQRKNGTDGTAPDPLASSQ
jgi:proline racemase